MARLPIRDEDPCRLLLVPKVRLIKMSINVIGNVSSESFIASNEQYLLHRRRREQSLLSS